MATGAGLINLLSLKSFFYHLQVLWHILQIPFVCSLLYPLPLPLNGPARFKKCKQLFE
jgi:hypothetical protein